MLGFDIYLIPELHLGHSFPNSAMDHLRVTMRPVEQRFWEKVRKTENCWLWIGGTSNRGYGLFHFGKGMVLAHRLSWKLHFGLIPDGLCALHRCDAPACVRPNHLFLGTYKDNMADKLAKGRGNPAKGQQHGSHTQPWTTPRGEKNGQAKITEAQVRMIRKDGRRSHVIASDHGLSKSTIWRIKHRLSWAHV